MNYGCDIAKLSKLEVNEIRNFFGKNDEFLEAQFAQALGVPRGKSVQESYVELTDFTRKLVFEDSKLFAAQKKWISIFENVSVHLGFEKLRELSSVNNQANHLNACRDEIDASKFIDTLESYSDTKFADAGLLLETSPDDWLKSYNVPFTSVLDPDKFKNALFSITGHRPALNAEYVFKKSKGGFFMMSLFLNPRFCIGYGSIDSLFGLSTLAHEIGHTTTPRERDLAKEFLEFPETVKDDLVLSNEDDSYHYECVFMENASELTEALGVPADKDLKERLVRRKAIQNNLHLLKNRMNCAYYSGLPLREISDSFVEQMKQIYPAYKQVSEFDWLKFATLDQPLSRIGYLVAYPKTFGRL